MIMHLVLHSKFPVYCGAYYVLWTTALPALRGVLSLTLSKVADLEQPLYFHILGNAVGDNRFSNA